ncbi:MAG: glycosyltransferase [Clostridia bacterium]|nr:glycosyltransferase [Clostridia bacterium]
MEDKKVSIIVPIYNSEAYLPLCIESMIKQTYKNIEILLIDDGSTDASLDVCLQYAEADERIKVIHQENGGVSSARNNGLDHMTGEYFAFVDSDDEIKENAIEFLLNDLLIYNADMASAVKSTVLPNGTITSVYEDQSLNVYSGMEMLRLSLEGERQTNSACAKLFKHSVFHAVRFAEGRSINEDGFFLFECYTLQPTVVQHNVSVYLYYVRSGSSSRNAFSDKYFDMLYFCERKKEIVQKNYPELSDHLITMEVSAHLFFLEILCRTTEAKYKPQQKASIKLVKKYYRVFDCMNQHERKMAWIVAHGGYPLYKKLIRLKYYRS